MLELRHLTKRFGSFAAIDDVSLGVRPGEIVGLLGRNGAGKTTLLRMASGTLAPTGGEVTVDGLDLFDGSPSARALVGYLPEGCPLPRDATVGEYLRFRAALFGFTRKRAAARAREVAERCGLEEVEGVQIASISSGMRVRCALAESISHSAHALLLDEPFASLDPIQVRAVVPIIREIAKKAAVVMSTHLLADASALCTRFVVLDRGRQIAARDGGGPGLADWFFNVTGSAMVDAGATATVDAGATASGDAVATAEDDAGAARREEAHA